MLEVRGLRVRVDEATVLRGVDLDAAPGAITAVMGPSGCGKTTLLRAIAGLQPTTAGTISWMGRRLDGLRPDQRHVGLMFQEHALFPHRSVAENVAFGLEMQRVRGTALSQRVQAALDLVDLGDLGDRTIDQLSGGEQQRVALARALAPEPNFVMLDEPLGSLDRTLQGQLLTDMRQLFHRLGITVLYVTHDHDEVFAIADDLVVMEGGRIEGAGPAEAMWADPGTAFIARFLGHQNLLTVEVARGFGRLGDLLVPLGAIEDGSHTVVVPGEAVRADELGDVTVTVESGSFRAGIHTATGSLPDGQTLSFTGGPFAPGSEVSVTIDTGRVVVVEA